MTDTLTGTIAYVDLGTRQVRKETLDSRTYRTYFGGTGLIARELLRLMRPGVDPLGPDNVLVIAAGPLTGGFGVGEGGGFFGPELRKSGFDALVIAGVSDKPVYLYGHDGEIEFRDASSIWGKRSSP